MRKFGLLTLSIAGVALAILGQDTWSDAKKALSDEWQRQPKQCMIALGDSLNAEGDPLSDLGHGRGDKVNAVYKDASSYPDFWQLVVTAPTTPSGGIVAKNADDACANARTVIDYLYNNAQIALLRTSLVREQTNPVGAIYLLLAAMPDDANWPQNQTDMRACFASDQAPAKLGTRLFSYVSAKLTRK